MRNVSISKKLLISIKRIIILHIFKCVLIQKYCINNNIIIIEYNNPEDKI